MGTTADAIAAPPGDGVPIPIGVERRRPWRTGTGPNMRQAHPEPAVATWRIVVNATATFLVVFGGGLLLTATVPRLFGYDSVVVSSGSMSPRIRTGDVVVTTEVDDIGLGPGSVIDFEREGETILHRIVSVTNEGYVTSGDANPTSDSGVVAPESVRGVGVVRVPLAGWPALWIERNQWLPLALFVLVTAGALHLSRTAWVMAMDDDGGSSGGSDGRDDAEATDALTRLQPYVTELVPPPIPQSDSAGSSGRDEVLFEIPQRRGE